jgi:hypothetical protein
LITGFSFFLYASHEPVLTVFKKGLPFVLGQGDMQSLLTYVLAPAFVILLCLSAGYCLNRVTPKFYALITGGRK